MLSAETITGINENDLRKITATEANALINNKKTVDKRAAFIRRFVTQEGGGSSGASSGTQSSGSRYVPAEEVTYDKDGIPTQPFKLDFSLGDQANPFTAPDTRELNDDVQRDYDPGKRSL
jgi:hypothetical protein